jgi:hypothetical protein
MALLSVAGVSKALPRWVGGVTSAHWCDVALGESSGEGPYTI